MKRNIVFRSLAFFALAGITAFAIGSHRVARQLTGPVHKNVAMVSGEVWSAVETVHFQSEDGLELAGWWLPHGNSQRAVLLLHGHGSTRRQMIARAELLHRHGYSVLLYDARGHGESAGNLVSFGYHETKDLLGAMAWVRARGATELGLIGTSQGGATIALASARLHDVRWVVLESVYPNLRNAVDRRCRLHAGLPGWFAGSLMVPLAEHYVATRINEIDPASALFALKCPVLIMSGDRDKHTAPDDSRLLFEKAPKEKTFWLVEGAAHVDLYGFAQKEYERKLLDFISAASAQTVRKPH